MRPVTSQRGHRAGKVSYPLIDNGWPRAGHLSADREGFEIHDFPADFRAFDDEAAGALAGVRSGGGPLGAALELCLACADEQARHRDAVLEHVRDARRRAHVVLEHAEVPVDVADQVDAGDVDAVGRPWASVLVGERRWNLRLNNGIDVQLPESDPAAALEVRDVAVETAQAAEAKGHKLTAASNYLRACFYYQIGDHSRQPKDDIAMAAYKKSLECFRKFAALADRPKIEVVELLLGVPERGAPVGVAPPRRRLEHVPEPMLRRDGQVLVAPQLALNAADSSIGKLWEPGGLARIDRKSVV